MERLKQTGKLAIAHCLRKKELGMIVMSNAIGMHVTLWLGKMILCGQISLHNCTWQLRETVLARTSSRLRMLRGGFEL